MRVCRSVFFIVGDGCWNGDLTAIHSKRYFLLFQKGAKHLNHETGRQLFVTEVCLLLAWPVGGLRTFLKLFKRFIMMMMMMMDVR